MGWPQAFTLDFSDSTSEKHHEFSYRVKILGEVLVETKASRGILLCSERAFKLTVKRHLNTTSFVTTTCFHSLRHP